MHNPAVTSGPAPVSRAIAAAADSRGGPARPLAEVAAAQRVSAFGRDSQAQRARSGEAAVGSPDRARTAAPARPGARDGSDLREGAPASSYLAQHIAQEVVPLDPGPDRYMAGARAYLMRRDSTVEILSRAARLDVLA